MRRAAGACVVRGGVGGGRRCERAAGGRGGTSDPRVDVNEDADADADDDDELDGFVFLGGDSDGMGGQTSLARLKTGFDVSATRLCVCE